jgi:hypothetical protein
MRAAVDGGAAAKHIRMRTLARAITKRTFLKDVKLKHVSEMPRTTVFVVAAVLALLARQPSVSATNRTDFVVSAYLPEWRYSGVDWSLVSQGVSHLILFSVEILPSGSIGALDRIPSPQNLQEARSAALKNGCRLMLCVGGNGRSAGYPIMVASKKLRARFLKDLLTLLDRLQLHGVDYNWCVPRVARRLHVSTFSGSTRAMIFALVTLQMTLSKRITRV